MSNNRTPNRSGGGGGLIVLLLGVGLGVALGLRALGVNFHGARGAGLGLFLLIGVVATFVTLFVWVGVLSIVPRIRRDRSQRRNRRSPRYHGQA
jgi:hypothetical protein